MELEKGVCAPKTGGKGVAEKAPYSTQKRISEPKAGCIKISKNWGASPGRKKDQLAYNQWGKEGEPVSAGTATRPRKMPDGACERTIRIPPRTDGTYLLRRKALHRGEIRCGGILSRTIRREGGKYREQQAVTPGFLSGAGTSFSGQWLKKKSGVRGGLGKKRGGGGECHVFRKEGIDPAVLIYLNIKP